jgi:HAAS domain-containing protein
VTARPVPAPPGTAGTSESYLAEVAARLPGPRHARAGIVAELRAGLLDAIDANRAAGMCPADADAAAIGEFGDPGEIARVFGPELAARQARRVALGVLGAGPLVGLLWALAALASHIGVHRAPPWQWAGAPPGAAVALPLIAAAVAVAAWTAIFALAATGRLTRWLPARPGRGPAAAAVAGYGVAAADMIILVLLASAIAASPGRLAPLPIAAAAGASLTRFTLARRAARRCLTARAALA